jgi:enamine deaminase RidA (YjgF/YER057c/UK114 family)
MESFQLPPAPRPLGAYVRAVHSKNLLFLSGMLPLRDGTPAYRGRIGTEVSQEQAREAVRLALLNGLSVIDAELGSLDRIKRIVRMAVYLQTAEDFQNHAAVADAASELIREMFGKRGEHVRLVFGVYTLPSMMPAEIELIVETDAPASDSEVSPHVP